MEHLFRPVCILNDRDRHGRPVLFFKLSNVKPDQSKCILKDILTAIACLTEALSEIEGKSSSTHLLHCSLNESSSF